MKKLALAAAFSLAATAVLAGGMDEPVEEPMVEEPMMEEMMDKSDSGNAGLVFLLLVVAAAAMGS